MQTLIDIAREIQMERIKREWSQDDFAGKVGCGITTLKNIESGYSLPTERWLKKVNRVLGTHYKVPYQNTGHMTLADVVHEARERKMSYGRYVASLYLQKPQLYLYK